MTTATEAARVPEPSSLLAALAQHWPEYLMESALLGAFMISACVFGVLLEHPASFIRQALDNDFVRHLLAGVVMGCTAIALILSPWGKRSGAHLNPAVTLTYLFLGKMAWRDATFYMAAQFAGGIAGVAIAAQLIGAPLRHSAVNYAVTTPGMGGTERAFAAEFLISGLLMTVVLITTNRRRLARFTPFLAGLCVAAFITFESPISGMSMNPARTFGSALAANEYTALWLYFVAPPLAMIAAAWFATRYAGHVVYCAKLHHNNHQRCIFRCGYQRMQLQEYACTQTTTT